MSDTRKWGWYQARFEESPYSGPFNSREEAIQSGRDEWDGDGFYIAEATNSPVLLSDWIDAEQMLERADESIFDNDRASSEYDDAIFQAAPDQEADFIARIKAACDEWQKAHALVFSCSTFEAMRNHEFIPASVEAAE